MATMGKNYSKSSYQNNPQQCTLCAQYPTKGKPQVKAVFGNGNDRMLQEDVIEPVTTDWAGFIEFAHKKNGSLRFCVDYCKLNAVAI